MLPPNVQPGMMLRVKAAGQEVSFQVPPGAVGGQKLLLSLPARERVGALAPPRDMRLPAVKRFEEEARAAPPLTPPAPLPTRPWATRLRCSTPLLQRLPRRDRPAASRQRSGSGATTWARSST